MSALSLVPGTVVLAALALAAPATAATTVGQTFVPTTECVPSSTAQREAFQSSRAAGTVAAPTAGVLTSWSYESGTDPASITLRAYRPTATLGDFTVIGDAGTPKDIPASSGLHTFNTRIPVQAGDLIGLRVALGQCASFSAVPTDVMNLDQGTVTPVGQAATYPPFAGFIVDVSAQLEPDADGDGFGDETQDACPDQATSQSPGCVDPNDATAPDTAISQGPSKRTGKRKVTFSFTSTEEFGTFYCRLKGPGVPPGTKHYRSCASPQTYRRLDPGRFRFSVVAADFWRNLDPTPAELKFRVR